MATPVVAVLPPDTNLAPTYMIPCSILAALGLGLCVARIYTRLKTSRLFADDYLIVIATTLSVVNIFLAGAASANGWGHSSFHVAPHHAILANKCLFALQLIWIFTLALVRVSVACSLLRFGSGWTWRAGLWTMITFHVLISFGWVVIQFFQCKPLRAFWEPVESFSCWDRVAIIDYGWFSAAYFVLMDLILALMPIKFVINLSRPTKERFLICCLMALGLCATAIAGVKMTTFKNVGLGDPLSATVIPSLYAKLEEQVGIIAACTPCLKSPMERLLHRLGMLSERHHGDMTKPSFVNSGNRGAAVSLGSFKGGESNEIRVEDGSASSTLRVPSNATAKGDSTFGENQNTGNERKKDGWEVV